jgi:homoserine dehydrogenase
LSADQRPLRLALVGFGSVGRQFAHRLAGEYGRALRSAGWRVSVTAIATARHGLAVDRAGLPLRRCLDRVEAGGSLAAFHRGPPIASTLDLVRRAPADVLLELSPLDPRSGQPAIRHVRAALDRGVHVITANKGPVAFARSRLAALARRKGVAFLHEGAVMDGIPVFNLVERCLAGARVTGFRGVLNATTTRILARLEEGADAEQALREARAAGIVEADAGFDLDGWDAAVKGCALAAALLGVRVRPDRIPRRGIRGLDPRRVMAARRRGRRIRLVVEARRRERGRVQLRVGPRELPLDDVLASAPSDGVLVLETDLAGELAIWQGRGGVDQTAYALLSDLLALPRAGRRLARR